MNHIPREAIESLKTAYWSDFGRDVCDAEAEEYGWTVLDALGVSIETIARAKQRNAQFESSLASEDDVQASHDIADVNALN